MSKRVTKSYTTELKERSVKLAIESNQPFSVTANELDISHSTLHTRVNKYEKAEAKVNDQHIYDEVKQLRKEVTKLKEECAILKKAAVGSNLFVIISRHLALQLCAE